MGILDWFKSRPSYLDPESVSGESLAKAIDKAVSLTNPRLKIVRDYQERLAPATATSVRYLRENMYLLPAAIPVSEAHWNAQPVLRAFFASAKDVSTALAHSNSLSTFFDKYPERDEACFVLGMSYSEQQVMGMSLRGDIVLRDTPQKVLDFSQPNIRICGHTDAEVWHLLGTQSFEYLVAQAMTEIGEVRSERQELEETHALIRARLRLLQQQGPGLGTLFNAAPAKLGEQMKLEAQLLENERQMETIGKPAAALEVELDCLREVLENPQRYLRFARKEVRLNTMNVVLDESDGDAAYDILFSLAELDGVPRSCTAFVLGHLTRADLPAVTRINFDEAARYL